MSFSLYVLLSMIVFKLFLILLQVRSGQPPTCQNTLRTPPPKRTQLRLFVSWPVTGTSLLAATVGSASRNRPNATIITSVKTFRTKTIAVSSFITQGKNHPQDCDTEKFKSLTKMKILKITLATKSLLNFKYYSIIYLWK